MCGQRCPRAATAREAVEQSLGQRHGGSSMRNESTASKQFGLES